MIFIPKVLDEKYWFLSPNLSIKNFDFHFLSFQPKILIFISQSQKSDGSLHFLSPNLVSSHPENYLTKCPQLFIQLSSSSLHIFTSNQCTHFQQTKKTNFIFHSSIKPCTHIYLSLKVFLSSHFQPFKKTNSHIHSSTKNHTPSFPIHHSAAISHYHMSACLPFVGATPQKKKLCVELFSVHNLFKKF